MHMGTRITTEPVVSLGTEILFAFLQASVLGFAGLCFVGCNYVIAEVVIVLMVTANATSMSGYMVN